jgi:hypothetical protein
MESAVDSVVGVPVDEVVVDIDYEIIEHFSQNLYGSPNKAVEELVANGYDALATAVYAYSPGAEVGERVVVWDDGLSMDIAGLKDLWHIAHSPKASGERTIEGEGVATRAVIGKFGIGKLASYQVGHRITHLCRREDEFLLVSLDYREIRRDLGPEASTAEKDQDEDAPASEPDPNDSGSNGSDLSSSGERPRYRAPISRLDEGQAREWADSNFIGTADAFDALWDKQSWTLAVVDELKDISLPAGRLRWVLGNGMPLRPDFKVYLNDGEVESKLGKNAEVTWPIDEKRILSELESEWNKARNDSRVSGDFEKGHTVTDPAGVQRPAIGFPQLGDLSAEVSIFSTSLATGVAADHGRSYGFFVMVRDRLLNPDDPQLLLGDPSFGTFYRTQFVIRADGLDSDLLANREQLRNTAKTQELEVLQKALYLAARKELDRRDQEKEIKQRSESLLPVGDAAYFREPMSALVVKEASSGGKTRGMDLSAPKISREALDAGQPIAVLDPDGNGFQVNDAHPFFAALRERLGGGKKAKEALRAFDLVAVSEKLLEGHLFDVGLDGAEVDAVLKWRDGLFRALADGYRGAPEDVVEEAIRTSYLGDEPFESALAEVFSQMGFTATRDGASGEKDILVIAPTGPNEARFTIEAKGSKGEIDNEKAVVAAAASHRDKVGASHAVIVAREFSGFKRKDKPAILEECESVKGVSIANLESVVELYRAVRTYFYPLDLLLPILAELEKPEDKRKHIDELSHPTDDFDYGELLEEIWNRQGSEASGEPVPYRSIHQEIWKPRGVEWGDFNLRLNALATLSRGLMSIKKSANEVVLLQSPEIIGDAIRQSMGGE